MQVPEVSRCSDFRISPKHAKGKNQVAVENDFADPMYTETSVQVSHWGRRRNLRTDILLSFTRRSLRSGRGCFPRSGGGGAQGQWKLGISASRPPCPGHQCWPAARVPSCAWDTAGIAVAAAAAAAAASPMPGRTERTERRNSSFLHV